MFQFRSFIGQHMPLPLTRTCRSARLRDVWHFNREMLWTATPTNGHTQLPRPYVQSRSRGTCSCREGLVRLDGLSCITVEPTPQSQEPCLWVRSTKRFILFVSNIYSLLYQQFLRIWFYLKAIHHRLRSQKSVVLYIF